MAPLIVITGPTASGKTGLALELAERYNGEIISADSRTIYRGMDIGTAKPTKAEQASVRHYGLDVVDPGDRFTARDFQQLAYEAIADIRARGKVPFLVGGTGLYIDAVVLEYQWPEQHQERHEYESLATDELVSMIKKQHISLPENQLNRRHLINTLRRQGSQGSARRSPQENTPVVAIATDKRELDQRITQRAQVMFESGVIEEAERLAQRYGWDSEAMTSNIYPIIRQLVSGDISRDEAVQRFIVSDRRLAKRQLTWLRRHDYIRWLPLDQARSHIETILG